MYEHYYREQSQESIARLFEGMLDYDFRDYWRDMGKIADMHSATKFSGDRTTLKTNGSTGGSKIYRFGPYFWDWSSKIEPFLRNMHDGMTIFLYARLGGGRPPSRLMFDEVHSSNKKHFETNANFLEDAQVEEVFSYVTDIYKTGHKVNFSSFPDVWNMLLSNHRFMDLCRDNSEKIGCFVNNDFEMLLTTEEFYVRDQMINWVSGVNFFVCKEGTRHFLPTFAPGSECLNLINLRRLSDGSDEVQIGNGDPIACACGRPYIPVEMKFHKNNRILSRSGKPVDFGRLGLSLKGRYATLQMHQDEREKVTVFANPVGELNKEDMNEAIRAMPGLEIEIKTNRYFEVGSKRYCFWRSESLNVKDFRLS